VTPAERLLQELGVTEPSEIDLEAIAFHLGARVRYRPLDGCEARIIGSNDVAVITVNERSSYPRKRFSIAHELGHWCHHRGKALVCRAEEFRPRDPTSPERIADAYAARASHAESRRLFWGFRIPGPCFALQWTRSRASVVARPTLETSGPRVNHLRPWCPWQTSTAGE
jgi:hypothetical protein